MPKTLAPRPKTNLAVAPDPDPDPGPIATPERELPVGPPRSSAQAEWFGELKAEDDYLKVLWYGVEGSGKTTAAAMAANQGRILVINAESGVKFNALRQQGIKVENIRVWPNPDNPQPITSATLEALHLRLLQDLRQDPGAWYAVVFDSLTEIHQALREQATERRVSKVQGVDPDWVDRDDYGVMTAQMRKTLRRFRDLPCHVLFTALETIDDKKDEIRPAITPALCNDVMGYVDIVMRMGSPTDDFRARCTKSGRIRAKDRFGLLPPRLMEPNFIRVKDYVINSVYADQDDEVQEPLRAEERAEEEKRAAEAAIADLDQPAPGKKKPARTRRTAKDAAAPEQPSTENQE
jgi:hypothetical protein